MSAHGTPGSDGRLPEGAQGHIRGGAGRDARGRVDPWQAVQAKIELLGEADEADLPRVAEALQAIGGAADWPARYRLAFGRDPEGRALARGRVELTATLVCQRCLGEADFDLDLPITLALILDDREADGLPDGLDPLPVGREGDSEPIRPLDLVEDELLLALPQVPMHPAGQCEVPDGRNLANPEADKPQSPFAMLAGLKGRIVPSREDDH
jgi:uncharacterized protein